MFKNIEQEKQQFNITPVQEMLLSLKNFDFTINKNARRIIGLSQYFWSTDTIPPLSICLNQRTNKSLYYLIDKPSKDLLKASLSITEPGLDERQGSPSTSGIGALILPRDGIASAEWYFQTQRNEVVVSSALVVRGRDRAQTGDDFQSKGYGTGLLLLNNILINDNLKKFPEFFANKSVTAIIDAQAHIYGQPHNQIADWTIRRARALGYLQTTEPNIFKRIFQTSTS